MRFNSMGAFDSNMSPVWFIIVALLSIHVSLATVQTVMTVQNTSKVCEYGTYEHNDRKCCQCGAGQRLKEHCTVNPDDTKCEHCEKGTYNSDYNAKMSCEPCTSCSHPNANLEVDEPCIPDSDTKCRCKKHHYCSSAIEGICKLCSPGGSNLYLIITISLTVLVVLAIIAFIVCWRKRWSRQLNITQLTNGNAIEIELNPLRAVDLSPHMPDIAEELGWKDMKAIAMRSNIKSASIEGCRLDYPGNSQEQTLQLLKIWTEQQGMEASRNLIQILQNSGKKGKAEKVALILNEGSSV